MTRRRLRLEETTELDPGEPRHPEVGHDRVRGITERELGPLYAFPRDLDLVAVRREARSEELSRALAVVDEHDAGHGERPEGPA